MQSFDDANGKRWLVRLTYGGAVEIRDTLGLDMLKPDESVASADSPMVVLSTDLEKLVSALYVVCADQISRDGTSPEEFAGLLAGETLAEARAAFFEAWVDFFRAAGMAPAATLLETMRSTVEIGSRIAVEAMKSRIEKVEPTLRSLSGNSPASSESVLPSSL